VGGKGSVRLGTKKDVARQRKKKRRKEKDPKIGGEGGKAGKGSKSILQRVQTARRERAGVWIEKRQEKERERVKRWEGEANGDVRLKEVNGEKGKLRGRRQGKKRGKTKGRQDALGEEERESFKGQKKGL